MIVGAAERHRLHRGARGGVVAIHQQHALGPRVQLVHAREDLRRRIIHEHQRDRLTGLGKVAESLDRARG